ncbi:hypothetical protein FNJ84_18115 [Paracoccus sp. M683]|uniref:hypothetical protein n=1 Tax=Paracoccus sp. M683 TaxID=2594268 RepID=UPI00117EC86A|nr:hypothetical protein [Paracoccus sp. M683]TRW94783.1 hypothetical protein FNJ84_18115 [Paracoccus sp. M683]
MEEGEIEFENFAELSELVDKWQGVVTCSMELLRDAAGAQKLGKHVVKGISDELAKRGLRHYPKDLPLVQWESARIYRVGTPAGKLIAAVLDIDDEDSNAEIRRMAGGDDAERIQRIREIVCD